MDIKFRAWDRKENKMISWWEILNYYNIHAMIDPASRDYDRYIIMQFTGKKDIHGIDIYEHDYVNVSIDFGPGGSKRVDVEIFYDIQDGYNWNYMNDEHLIIIGNKFEGMIE